MSEEVPNTGCSGGTEAIVGSATPAVPVIATEIINSISSLCIRAIVVPYRRASNDPAPLAIPNAVGRTFLSAHVYFASD